MPLSFCVLLSDTNLSRHSSPAAEVDRLLLERTLFDPPRAAAAIRWASQLRDGFPNAELIPYVWHMVSHGPDDGYRELSTRTLTGPPHAFGHLQDTPQVRQAWDAFAQTLSALEAKRIVVRTPPTLAPGAIGRTRIQKFVAQHKSEALDVLWEPEGLWSPVESSTLARSLGIDVLGRALSAGRPEVSEEDPVTLYRADAWLRIDGTGRRPRISADQLDALAEHVEEHPNSILVFAGPQALTNLRAAREELD